jgi:hypothetical protein
MLCDELHRKGSLEWSGLGVPEFLERVANRIDHGETGWGEPAGFRRFCDPP